jgi:hypothetical protein
MLHSTITLLNSRISTPSPSVLFHFIPISLFVPSDIASLLLEPDNMLA